MAVTAKMKKLLQKVKDNAVITHDGDDTLLLGLIAAAIDYMETYQKVKHGRKSLPPSTEQAVIILATHWYESRDGSTGGFFADTAAGDRVWETIHRLLAINRNIEV